MLAGIIGVAQGPRDADQAGDFRVGVLLRVDPIGRVGRAAAFRPGLGDSPARVGGDGGVRNR